MVVFKPILRNTLKHIKYNWACPVHFYLPRLSERKVVITSTAKPQAVPPTSLCAYDLHSL